MLAVAGPVTGSEHVVSGLAQARTGSARVQGLETEQARRQLEMTTHVGWRSPAPKDGETGGQALVVGQVEVKHDRTARDRAGDDVEAKRNVAASHQQMLAPRT